MSEDKINSFIEVLYKPTYELFRQLQDYLKVLITLNTATILIIIAFLEKIFPAPRLKPLIMVSFLCFTASLVASLLFMTIIIRSLAFLVDLNSVLLEMWSLESPDLSVREQKRGELQKKAKEISLSKLNFYTLGNYFYMTGVVLLVIFVVVNFLWS